MKPVTSRLRRARAAGAVVLIAVFATGLVAGTAWTRARGDRVNVNIRMTTELPRELRRLDVSPAQEDSLRRILVAGQRRIRGLLSDFEPRLRMALDSIDAEVRDVLTPAQRARFAPVRAHRRDEVQIDTVRR